MKKVLYAFLMFSLLLVSALFSVPKVFAYDLFDPVPGTTYYGMVYQSYEEAGVVYASSAVYTGELGDASTIDCQFTGNQYSFNILSAFNDFAVTEIYVIWNETAMMWDLNPAYHNVDSNPVLTGDTAFVTNFDDMITMDELLSRIQAIDNEDGDISHLIQVTNNTYAPSGVYPTSAGTYIVDLSVTDSSGNNATLQVQVLVKDVTAPVINGTKTYNQSYTTKKNVADILAALSVTDNHDTTLPSIIVKTDNYSANYNKIGPKIITFSSTDSSGNEGLYDVTVNVIDDVKPTFSGPTTIMKGQSEILTLSQITAQISANDAIDGVVAFTVVTDNYTGNGAKVGSWTITYQATDIAGNSNTHTVTVTVADNIPPVFYVDNYFISVSQSITLSRQDIIDLLTASGQLTVNATTNVLFNIDEYSGNEGTVGIYAMSVSATSSDGTEEQVSLAIEVTETIIDDNTVIVEPETSLWDDVWSWIKSPVKANSKIHGWMIIAGTVIVIAAAGTIFGRKRRW